MKKLVVFKTASMSDLERSIKLGVWARRKGGLKPSTSDVIVFQFKGDYYVTGVYLSLNPNITINVDVTNENWDGKDNIEGQHEFIPFKDKFVFTKQEFETRFPSTRSENKGKPVSTGFNHYININDDQYIQLFT